MVGDEVGEEEQFQYNKDDEQLDENHCPERFSYRHISEPVVIQVPDILPKSLFFHGEKVFLIGNRATCRFKMLAKIINGFLTAKFNDKKMEKKISECWNVLMKIF